jgi:hypothetical protein
MGVGSTLEQATSNGPQLQKQSDLAASRMQSAPGMQMEMQPGKAQVSKDANSVPGFPQDAFMEGPPMAMDQMAEKPETFGLRPGWSGFLQGMMTLVRVLPSDQYDHIMELRAKRDSQMPGTGMPDSPSND